MRTMASSASPKGIAAIVGVGAKLGRSIALKFAHEGYTVAILARDLGQYTPYIYTITFSAIFTPFTYMYMHIPVTQIDADLIVTGRLSRFADEIAREEKAQVFAIRIDCSESRSIKEAFEGVLSLGFVEILVYNAYHPISWSPTNFADIRLDHFEKSIAVSAVGAFHCAQQVLPGMVDRGRGTILFTGCSASLYGIAGFSDLCCGKFAMRGLAQCLAREFQPRGVHVAHVIIDGIVSAPRGTIQPSSLQQRSSSTSSVGESHGEAGDGSMDPDALAQTYWQLHVQDRCAWTQEIDLRPTGPMKNVDP